MEKIKDMVVRIKKERMEKANKEIADILKVITDKFQKFEDSYQYEEAIGAAEAIHNEIIERLNWFNFLKGKDAGREDIKEKLQEYLSER